MKKFLVLISLFSSLSTHAEVDLKKATLPNGRVIRVTGHPDYPPVIWAKKGDKELKGIAVEMIKKIFKDIDVKVEFINVETWGRAQEEVKAGRIDMLLPPYKTDDRLSLYNYSANAFMMDETVIFVKAGKEFHFENFDDLLKYPGAAIINDSFGNQFDEFEKAHRFLTRLPTTEQCFRFVEKDRARYIIAGINSGLSALMKMGWEKKFTILPKRLIVTGLYAPISLKSPWNTPEINTYLKKKFAEQANSKDLKELEKKYLALFRDENTPSKQMR